MAQKKGIIKKKKHDILGKRQKKFKQVKDSQK